MDLKQLIRFAKMNGVDVGALSALVPGPGAEVDASKFKKLSLEAGMYQDAARDGVSFSEFLERQDPSENYPGVELDAFQRQLAAHGLAVKGPGCVNLEAFYKHGAVLFPEWVDRQVRVGQIFNTRHFQDDDVVRVEEQIDSSAFEAMKVDPITEDDYAYAPVAEGAEIPRIKVDHSDVTGKLRKHGFVLEATYDFLADQRMDMISVWLQIAALKLIKDKAEHALDILINGVPGNANPAVNYPLSNVDLTNFITFSESFDVYEPSLMIADTAGVTAIKTISEFASQFMAAEWLRRDRMETPVDSMIKKHVYPNSSLLTNNIVGVDQRFALKRIVRAGSRLVETDKLITSQWQQIVVSEKIAYDKMLSGEVVKVWDYS